MHFNITGRIDLLNFLKDNSGIAIEIGVQKGIYSEIILNKTKLKKVYSVDYQKKEDVFREAQTRLKKFGNRSILIKEDSLKASKQFNDVFFEFIYIDADHKYESVKNDLRVWWPKLKKGGIFAGHDYFLHTVSGWENLVNVKKAVDEFVKENNLELILTCSEKTREPNTDNWIIFK